MRPSSDSHPCPCGLGDSLAACCGRFHAGKPWPPTAEALMRARYAAFVVGAIDFLLATHHPDTVQAVDRAGIEAWSRGATWRGLTILATEDGGPRDDTGMVEFTARYTMNGIAETHHERSRFVKEAGRWYFLDGHAPASPCPPADPHPRRGQPPKARR